MVDISSSGPIDPNTTKAYRDEFIKSANLFQQALTEYNQTTEYNKMEQLKKTMNEALTVMQQIVKVALKSSEQTKEAKVVKDYNSYLSDQTDQNYKTLTDDLDDLQGSIQG
jgi:predicted metalloendopeptidase